MSKHIVLIFILFQSWLWCQDSYNITLLDNWSDTSLLKGAENAIFSDCWGFKYLNETYVCIGSTEGTHLFKIKDDNLHFIDFKAGRFQSLQVQHRDYKTYQNYLYAVCDEGQSSLQIFDMSSLPDSLTKVYDSNEYFDICHNIFIDTINAKLYACGSNGIGMKILDISSPTQPQLYYDFYEQNYVHDCFVKNDTAYLNCGFDGLAIYSFEQTPIQELGILDFYQEQGYNHSGWLNENGNTYVFIDETEGKRVKICDASDLLDVSVKSLYGPLDYQNYVPHNIQIFADFAFISYYNLGLRIVDVMNQNRPKEVAFFDTFYQETDYKLNGAWGIYVFADLNYILISDRQNGLFLFHFPIQKMRVVKYETSVVTSTTIVDSDHYIIYKTEDMVDLTFLIYDLNGQLIHKKTTNTNWLVVPNYLAAGTYFYHILSNNESKSSGQFIIL